MTKTADFTFLRHEQPDEEAWRQLNSFAARWNSQFSPKLVKTLDFLWTISFKDAQTSPEFDAFMGEIGALRSRYSIQYHVTSANHLEPADFRKADFVEILGISLEGIKGRPFILNEKAALGPPVPCPTCGWQDMFSVVQKAPFAIDEGLLDHPLADGGDPPPGGWDCINLPNGHKLISARVVDILRQHAIRGWEVLPVKVDRTNRDSTRVFQILASRAVLVMHDSSSKDSDKGFCPTCGAARALSPDYDSTVLRLAPDYCVAKEDVKTDEIFSRHPARGAMLYVAHRVYELFMGAGLNGILPSTVLSLCPLAPRNRGRNSSS